MSGTQTPSEKLQRLLEQYNVLTTADWPTGKPALVLRWIRATERFLLKAALIDGTYDPDQEEEMPKALEPPKSGTFKVGDRFDNIAPVVQGDVGEQWIVAGWVCVQAGSPGVWVEIRPFIKG